MYNRYIPQSDGSYHRRPVQGSSPPAQKPPRPPREQPAPMPQAPPAPSTPPDTHGSVPGFLKQLLPKDFDTGDLLIVLLLLLMAGDCEEEKNNALLTLALYFFM